MTGIWDVAVGDLGTSVVSDKHGIQDLVCSWLAACCTRLAHALFHQDGLADSSLPLSSRTCTP